MQAHPWWLGTAVAGIVAAACATAGGAVTVELVKDGQPAASIVLAKPATRAAQLAALEVQWHVEKITGARLPIVAPEATPAGAKILVGESAATQALGLKAAEFKYQEFLVRLLPDTVVLLGRDKDDRGEVRYGSGKPGCYETWPDFYDEQGTLHAAYDFLERFCGVRWFSPAETGMVYEPRKTLAVSGADIRRVPGFRNRNACVGVHTQGYDAVNCLWTEDTAQFKQYEAAAHPALHAKFTNSHQYMLAKRDENGLFMRRMRAGGERCFCNHSMYSFYERYWAKSEDPGRAKLFVEQKPEIFAKGYAKESVPPQMCYTSTELVRLVAQQARNYFDKGGYTEAAAMESPGPGWGENYFAVEPMDNASWCQCPECRKWYPDPKEAQTDPFLGYRSGSAYKFQFVNAVAREVRKTHPDKFITTLAYGATMAYSTKVKLEPNVAVFFCFDFNRNVYATKSYEFQLSCLKEWAAKEKDRPLYLWLYYTFPNEIAGNNKFFCFPGFFAHKIGEQMKLFHELGIRGMFHCGYGQEVEAYVTWKLMDDPALDVDKILDEYFAGLYGPGGSSLKKLYCAIEETYCNPKNYPDGYDLHQSKIVAWDCLGTEPRMAAFGKLMDEARSAVGQGSQANQRNVDLFDKATWSYMVAGRAHHMQHSSAPIPALTAPRIPDAGGDPDKADWAKSAALRDPKLPDQWYQRGLDTPSARKFSGRIAHDGKWLYLELVDPCDTKKLEASSGVFCYDDFEIFFARQRALPYRQYAIGPTALFVALSHGEVNWRMNVGIGEHGVVPKSDTSAPDKWVSRMAYPLDKFVPGGVKPGQKVYMNVTRVTGPKLTGGAFGIDTWVSFCSVHDVDRLAEVTLGE